MADGFTITKFRDVADGLQAGQFAVGERRQGSAASTISTPSTGTCSTGRSRSRSA